MQWLKTLLLKFLPPSVVRSLSKWHHARQLRSVRLEEEPDLKVVQVLVRPGQTVMDVGANVGLYTRVLSAWVGSTGRVVSLEPIPDTYAVLQHVRNHLKLENVSAFNVAASERAGRLSMAIPRRETGTRNPYQARVTGSHAPVDDELSIEAIRLDDLVDRHGWKIDLIKIDVEGHELSAVKGCAKTIERDRPALLIEVWGDLDVAGTSAHTLVADLARLGYAAYWFDGTRLHRRVRGDKSDNYFFLQEAHLPALAPGLTGVRPAA